MKKIISFIVISIFLISSVSANEFDFNNTGEKIAYEAALWLGSPYGVGNGEDGYGYAVDCSGLVMQVYKAFGVELPRTSHDQALAGEKIPLDEMIAGDIVCFVYEDGQIGHVGIYVGGNTMIHSPRPGKMVEFSSNFEDWGSIKAVYGRRLDVQSDYLPPSPDEDVCNQLNEFLNSPNSLTTDHLNKMELAPEDNKNPDEDLESEPMSKTVVLQIDNPNIEINGISQPIDDETEITPFIVNNRTHLPLRKIAEEFGAEVIWIGGESGEIQLKYNDNEITLWVNSERAIVNGTALYIETAPTVMYNRTFLPIRFIADEFGWDILWDEKNKTVTLSV